MQFLLEVYLGASYDKTHGRNMFSINNLLQKAQSLVDATSSPISKSSDQNSSKAALFRLQFRLPDSQSPLHDITAELALSIFPSSTTPRSSDSIHEKKHQAHSSGNVYTGRLHLSESFLCFSTQASSFQPSASFHHASSFTGQTYGAGPAGNGFTLPLCAIRRVERLDSQNDSFALAITTWNSFKAPSSEQRYPDSQQKFTVCLSGSRQACERFCDSLKKGLRAGVKELKKLEEVVAECYSEYLLSGNIRSERVDANAAKGVKGPPDAGLGMIFKYPGDLKKQRDKGKMRLWGEYFRGVL